MFASFPRSPADSAPATPGAAVPRRRIRCKMCRTELATREHMLDHGQVGPATPAAALSPVQSRRPSTHAHDGRPKGLGMTPMTPLQAVSRRNSASAGNAERMAFTSLATLNGEPIPITRRLSGTNGAKPFELHPLTPRSAGASRSGSFGGAGAVRPRRPSGLAPRPIPEGVSVDDSSAIADDDDDEDEENEPKPKYEVAETTAPTLRRPSGYMSPADLAAQLRSNPKLAALRSPGGIQPISPLSPLHSSAPPKTQAVAPPLLINNACSGYFVEPMRWMEPFLESGDLGGKIICPNKKCGAKLGNYDWAGVCCSCKEWVTPVCNLLSRFCIARAYNDLTGFLYSQVEGGRDCCMMFFHSGIATMYCFNTSRDDYFFYD